MEEQYKAKEVFKYVETKINNPDFCFLRIRDTLGVPFYRGAPLLDLEVIVEDGEIFLMSYCSKNIGASRISTRDQDELCAHLENYIAYAREYLTWHQSLLKLLEPELSKVPGVTYYMNRSDHGWSDYSLVFLNHRKETLMTIVYCFKRISKKLPCYSIYGELSRPLNLEFSDLESVLPHIKTTLEKYHSSTKEAIKKTEEYLALLKKTIGEDQ